MNKARFALRLNMALDRMGAPALLGDRTRFLAAHLAIDQTTARDWLRGMDVPAMESLLALCNACRQQPGFFLDVEVPIYPDDTRLITALRGGESMVLRVGGLGHALGEGTVFHYVEARSAMGYGVVDGERIVCASLPGGGAEAVEGGLYLIALANGSMRLVKCTGADEGRSTFSTGLGALATGLTTILPMGINKRMSKEYMVFAGIEYIGLVVLGVRTAGVMKKLGLEA
jgi:hypothetical protein